MVMNLTSLWRRETKSHQTEHVLRYICGQLVYEDTYMHFVLMSSPRRHIEVNDPPVCDDCMA